MLGYKFRRQYSVGAYVVDFYCAELRLAIEVDGDSHFQDGSQARDKQRDAFIKSLVLIFCGFEMSNYSNKLNDVLSTIARKVLEYRKPPCSPPLSKGDGAW